MTMTWKLLLLVAVLAGCGSDPVAAPATVPAPSSTTTITYGAERARSPQARTIVATARRRGKVRVYRSSAVTELDNPRLVERGIEVPLVLLVREMAGGWLEVSLPVRPNGSLGFVLAADFELSGHDYQIEVFLSQYRLRVLNGSHEVFSAPIGVAKESTPTPGGLYYTVEVLQPPDPNGVYGPYAIGLSGYSDVHRSFNGGPGQLGIHGTNEPAKVGSRVSNGCIRLKNDDITRLVELGLPLGTPVIVRS